METERYHAAGLASWHLSQGHHDRRGPRGRRTPLGRPYPAYLESGREEREKHKP